MAATASSMKSDAPKPIELRPGTKERNKWKMNIASAPARTAAAEVRFWTAWRVGPAQVWRAAEARVRERRGLAWAGGHRARAATPCDPDNSAGAFGLPERRGRAPRRS